MSRRTPRIHSVKGHVRGRAPVRPYVRGRGAGQPILPSRVVEGLGEPAEGNIQLLQPLDKTSSEGLKLYIELGNILRVLGSDEMDYPEAWDTFSDSYSFCLRHRTMYTPEWEQIFIQDEIDELNEAEDAGKRGATYRKNDLIAGAIPTLQSGIAKVCSEYWEVME